MRHQSYDTLPLFLLHRTFKDRTHPDAILKPKLTRKIQGAGSRSLMARIVFPSSSELGLRVVSDFVATTTFVPPLTFRESLRPSSSIVSVRIKT